MPGPMPTDTQGRTREVSSAVQPIAWGQPMWRRNVDRTGIVARPMYCPLRNIFIRHLRGFNRVDELLVKIEGGHLHAVHLKPRSLGFRSGGLLAGIT